MAMTCAQGPEKKEKKGALEEGHIVPSDLQQNHKRLFYFNTQYNFAYLTD